MGVAICDVKCRNLWQRQNMFLMTYIYSISMNMLFIRLPDEADLSHLFLLGDSTINIFFFYTSCLGTQKRQ